MKSHRMIDALASHLGLGVIDGGVLLGSKVYVRRPQQVPARVEDFVRLEQKVDLLLNHLGLTLVDEPRLEKRSGQMEDQ